MLETYKQLIANQFEAAMCTLYRCVVHCPDNLWQQPVASHPYSQSVFHTLFFTDVYLGKSDAGLKDQEFHVRHREIFADYEQLEYRLPVGTYEKEFILEYLEHCRQKAATVFSSDSGKDLGRQADFPRLNMTRAELYVYQIRHIQHHAAQLILCLRKESDVDMPWIKSGWVDE